MSTSRRPVEVTHPHIERKPGVQGSRAVIRGTRFPVSSIVENHRRGLTVDDILREFPHLTPAQVYDALSYYYDHRKQIDEEVEQLTDLQTAIANHPPTLEPRDGGD